MLRMIVGTHVNRFDESNFALILMCAALLLAMPIDIVALRLMWRCFRKCTSYSRWLNYSTLYNAPCESYKRQAHWVFAMQAVWHAGWSIALQEKMHKESATFSTLTTTTGTQKRHVLDWPWGTDQTLTSPNLNFGWYCILQEILQAWLKCNFFDAC
jgi:hypothetical protein